MECWWNDTDREKPKYLENKLYCCHSVDHNFHTDWPGIKLGASGVTKWQVMAEPRMCEACSEAGEAGTYKTFL
jgi:hypothetical protein